jgi:site-specific DNA recombinase
VGEKLGEVDQQLAKVEARRAEVQAELAAIESEAVREEDVRRALAQFDGVWDQLAAREKARVLNLLVERIDYDAEAGTLDITYRPGGIKVLAGGGA